MKKFSLVLIMLIIGLCIPSVSAEVLYDDFMSDYTFTGGSYIGKSTVTYGSPNRMTGIVFPDITKCGDISYIAATIHADVGPFDTGEYELLYWFSDTPNEKHPLHLRVLRSKNILGQVVSTTYYLYFDEWSIGNRLGEQTVLLSETLGTNGPRAGQHIYTLDENRAAYIHGRESTAYVCDMSISCGVLTNHKVKITDDETSYHLNIQRIFGNNQYYSNVYAYAEDEVIYENGGNYNLQMSFLKSDIDRITLLLTGKTHEYVLDSTDTPSSSNINVYIQNSQTGVLIANSHILISANVNDTFHEVINETLPGGIYNGPLQPTGGGMPNPDYYRLIATAEGYNSIMPYIDFEFDEAVTIYAVLEPIGGAPLDENNTFIDFYVRDLSANPISGATVNFGGYTLITNSAGYTIFEVEKDNTYSWIVSKSGYGSLTGNAAIGSDARHTINTVIAPSITPTTPTSIPTQTHISPTPTMTAPTGESVSNLLEWFAAHFGMLLGGGVEIGKIFMWLCFTVPVGVYVGKEAKAGAAGFMAGAGIVTLFFVLIGWVPIWIVVLLALIIGLLYAKMFNNSDNGGGR